MFCSRSDSVKIKPGADSLLKKITSTVTGAFSSSARTVDSNVGKATKDVPKLNLENITPQMWFMLMIFVIVVSAMCKCKYDERVADAKATSTKPSYYYY